jgi:hypothetical protein
MNDELKKDLEGSDGVFLLALPRNLCRGKDGKNYSVAIGDFPAESTAGYLSKASLERYR